MAEYETVDDDRLQAIVSQALESAADYLDEELSPVRVKASEYYAGEPFGDEVEGQSQVVSRDVSDVVRAILPSLVRVFTGSERAMEYVPQGPEDEAVAEALRSGPFIDRVSPRNDDVSACRHHSISVAATPVH